MKYLTFFIMLLSVIVKSQDDVDKWRQERLNERVLFNNQSSQNLATYKKSVEADRKKWQQTVNAVKQKWGKFTDSTPKVWAEYDKSLDGLSVVDFEGNKLSIQAITSKNDSQKAKEILKKQLKDIFKRKDPVSGNKVMDKQLDFGNGNVDSSNTDSYIDDLWKNVSEKKITGSDGKDRYQYSVNTNLSVNSLSQRATRYLPTVITNAEKYNLEVALIMGIIETESSFNPLAISRTASGTPVAYGLMQIIPSQAGRDCWRIIYGKDKIPAGDFLLDPNNNLQFGACYIDWLFKWWAKRNESGLKKEYLSIASYNQGVGTILKFYSNNSLSDSNAATLLSNLSTTKQLSAEGRNYTPRVLKYKNKYVNK